MLVEVVFNLSLTGILWQLLPCRRCLNIFWGINMRMVNLQDPDYIFWGWEQDFQMQIVQICGAYFKRDNQPWDLYKRQLNAYLGRKMLRKHRTKCNNCCTPVIQTSELVRYWSIFVILPQFPNNWFAVFQSDSRPVLQHFLKHLLQGR